MIRDALGSCCCPPSLCEIIWKSEREIGQYLGITFVDKPTNKSQRDSFSCTCDPCIVFETGCRFGEPVEHLFSGTLVLVGDVGAVLLVGPCAVFAVARPVPTWTVGSVLRPCGFLPLKPAGQRGFTLEVKIPAPPVLLNDLLKLQLQVPAQLAVVHRAKQAPANRLPAPGGLHPSNG